MLTWVTESHQLHKNQFRFHLVQLAVTKIIRCGDLCRHIMRLSMPRFCHAQGIFDQFVHLTHTGGIVESVSNHPIILKGDLENQKNLCARQQI